MKVMHVASGDLWGGAESMLRNLVLAQNADARYQVQVVLFNKGKLYRELVGSGVGVRVVAESNHSVIGLAKTIREKIRKDSVQIIHSHGFKENFVTSLASWLEPGCSSVRTVHGGWEVSFKAAKLRNRIIRVVDWVIRGLMNFSTVYVSDNARKESSWTAMAKNTAVVENAVDCEELKNLAKMNLKLPIRDARYHIGFFGRLVPVKRLDLIIEVFEIVVKRLGGNVQCVVAGEGPMLSQTEQDIESRGLQDHIDMLGFCENIYPLLAQMDAVVLMSDHEGLPMVVLEAICLSVPVVSANLPTVAKVVDEHLAGHSIHLQDPMQTAELIVELLQGEDQQEPKPLSHRYTAIGCKDAYGHIYKYVCSGNA